MIVTLNEAKSWLKVDYEDENSDIQLLVDASEMYMKNAFDTVYDNTNPLAKLYCRVLITDWYENKGLMSDSKVSDKVRFTLRSIMMQLRYSETGVV